jgi:hypothetical protein
MKKKVFLRNFSFFASFQTDQLVDLGPRKKVTFDFCAQDELVGSVFGAEFEFPCPRARIPTLEASEGAFSFFLKKHEGDP